MWKQGPQQPPSQPPHTHGGGGGGGGGNSNSMGGRRAERSPDFDTKLKQMALPLRPLVEIRGGQIHPAFPSTILNFWLLTDEQLDELAHFYHQRTPSQYTFGYPCPITWGEGLTIEEKRRKMGKFIGLKGCETPIRMMSEDEIEAEARRARWKEEEEEVFRRKMPWYS
ncbi:hypothetical protein VM1G_01662 [Cytospora mali]|uniref:Beta-xylosidase n=1 Tax=Cytospora mali TaxID=578113 RepID=A0A194VSM7_CYTMA|nr:hypothetical protein VM1G_01662 [Valsa mali]